MQPRSVAVVGASARAGRSNAVLRNLRQAGYVGAAYAINPRYDEVDGYPCHPTVQAVPGGVDCVVTAIPAGGVVAALEEAYAAGTRAAIVLASGFGEGNGAADDDVRALQALAAKGMSICGPNCFGVVNARTGAAVFNGPIPDPLPAGNVAFVSQSGGLASQIAAPLVEDRGIGLSYLVSCGNQLGLTIEDYLGYCVNDERTDVVAAFVEGFRDLAKLAAVAARARTLRKPIVVLKPGRSERGRAAAMSHTGSLAGSPEILRALLRRHGIVQVESIEELIETTCLLASPQARRPLARAAILLTPSGGEASHFADAAEDAGVDLPALAPQTEAAVRELLPDYGNVGNPLDWTGGIYARPELFGRLIDAALADPSGGAVVVNLPGRAGGYPLRHFARDVAACAAGAAKPIVVYGSLAAGALDDELVAALREGGVPYLAGTQRTVQALAALHDHQAFLASDAPPVAPDTPSPAARPDLPTGALPFLAAREVLADFGIETVATELAADADAAVAAAERLGYPVAVKVEAPGLTHKSDAGGVVLGCADAASVREAFARVTAIAPGAAALVQPMAAGGHETIVGVSSDPLLGPAVMFGLGGVYVEIVKDVAMDVAPLSRAHARGMIERTAASAILAGARGGAPADLEALERILVAVGELAVAYRDRLVALDLNPVLVGPDGATVVDAVIELKEDQ